MGQLLQIYQNYMRVLLTFQKESINESVWFLYLYTADRLGRFIVAGGAAVGLGALCYYGMGMSSELGAIEKAA